MNKLLNIKELVNYLSIKEPTIRDWIKYKTIPFYKINKSIRFDINDIEEWLKNKRKGHNSIKNESC